MWPSFARFRSMRSLFFVGQRGLDRALLGSALRQMSAQLRRAMPAIPLGAVQLSFASVQLRVGTGQKPFSINALALLFVPSRFSAQTMRRRGRALAFDLEQSSRASSA